MNAGGTAWWPLTRKIRAVVGAFVTLEAAAVAGELVSGTPGWPVILGGAVIGVGGIVSGYLTQDESSPAP